ncbi:MAG: ATP synthase F1 subunit gamma [Candidatus Omnitrophota bacterium]|nr:ATP synthase F1 subunit gamma [Candidatus Omnitrophota bacterium]
MQNLRALRQRIRSVQNTQKITKAMQMVAGAKLRRSLEELVSFRPYAEALGQVTQRFLSAHPGLQHPLIAAEQSEAPAGLVILTSDTGLCGTYNEKVLSAADRFRMEFPSAVVVAIGRKGTRSLAHRGGPRPAKEIVTWGGRYDPAEAGKLLGWLESEYLEGKVSSWDVATTRFISALSWKPVVERLLPAERPAVQEYPEKVIVEPEAAAFADRLLRRQLRSQFARVLREAFTAEHSARMVAMKNATENADEMISSLTLVRNKARQATITKELIEVVSGAEALK